MRLANWMTVSRPKVWQWLYVALLCLVVAIQWGVLSLPVVLFYLPSEIDSSGSGDADFSVMTSGELSPPPNSSEEQGSSTETGNCSTIQCSEGFSCTVDATFNISVCRPQCGTWMQYSRGTQLAVDILTIFGGVIGLIAGTASLIITGIRWRKVLTFPSVFSVYLNISLMIYAFINLVSFMDRPTLYCSSTDLQESVENPTSFCTFTGILLHFILTQVALFWFIHVAALFFIIIFPFRAKAFRETKRFKYIHITGVIVAVIYPTIPVIVIATTGGFTLASFPPQLCDGRNPDAVFYSFLLPIIIVSQVGTTLLLLLFYSIHKHYGLFRARQSKNPFSISTAERKILISLCYYLVMTVSAVIAATLFARDADNFETALQDYFTCEAQDFAPETSCDRSGYLNFTYPLMLAITLMFIELFPAVNLIYVVDFEKAMQMFGCWHHSSSSQ